MGKKLEEFFSKIKGMEDLLLKHEERLSRSTDPQNKDLAGELEEMRRKFAWFESELKKLSSAPAPTPAPAPAPGPTPTNPSMATPTKAGSISSPTPAKSVFDFLP